MLIVGGRLRRSRERRAALPLRAVRGGHAAFGGPAADTLAEPTTRRASERARPRSIHRRAVLSSAGATQAVVGGMTSRAASQATKRVAPSAARRRWVRASRAGGTARSRCRGRFRLAELRVLVETLRDGRAQSRGGPASASAIAARALDETHAEMGSAARRVVALRTRGERHERHGRSLRDRAGAPPALGAEGQADLAARSPPNHAVALERHSLARPHAASGTSRT